MDYKKFIDSVVGNIARKIEDEFNENDHPRDKGGKFTTKGGEGKGGSKKELVPETETEKAAKEELSEQKSNKNDQIAEKLSADASSADEFLTRMGYDNFDIGDEEEILGLIKKAFKNNPNKALKVAGDYIELGSEASSPEEDEPDEGLDDYGEKLLEYASDIDTANDALRALNWDTSDYEDLEQARTALKEAISQNPKAAKELWESTSNKEEIEEVRAGRETDKIVEEFKGSGIDMYAAMADLGLDVQNTPEEYQIDAFKEALFNSPKFRKKAASYIKQYRNTEDEEEWFK